MARVRLQLQVYELPELDEYGTSPDTAPVHEVPELKFSINDINQKWKDRFFYRRAVYR